MATAEEYAQWIVANSDKKGTPQFETVAAAYKDAKSKTPVQSQAVPAPQQINTQSMLSAVEPPNWFEQQLAKLPSMSSKTESQLRGFAMGAADPSVGLVQLGLNAIGQGDSINKAVAAKEAEYEAGRANSGRDGIDAYRIGGNIAAPTNIIAASKLAPVLANSGRVVQGISNGTFGGLAQPIANAEGTGDYFGKKSGQAAIGAITGGFTTPLMGKLGDAIGRRVAVANINTGDASLATDRAIAEALKEVGQTVNDIPPNTLAILRQQVLTSLQHGKQLDAAALLRKSDFDSLNMPSLRGQITRDPTQFAKEMNLRGALNLGEPIQQRIAQQDQILQNKVGSFAAGAKEAYPAGAQISKSLGSIDENMRSGVNSAYAKAKDHLGRAAPMDHVAFSREANLALDEEMLGSVLPASARSILNDVTLGKIPFNVNTAVQIDKTLSALQRSGNSAEALAIGKVRTALNSAPIADNVGADAKMLFDTARGEAKKRFNLHDAIPALKAASDGSIAPDDFVRRFVINGKTEEVNGLAKLLQKTDPEAFNQARAQIGAELQRAAFGENQALDKSLSPERFAKTLRSFGRDKLSAFFSPEEIDQMNTIARVAAYKNSTPSNAAVNYSNTGSAMMNLMGRIPGAPAALSLANSAKNTIDNSRIVRDAVSASVPSSAVDMPGSAKNLLARLLGGSSVIGGGLLAGSVGK